MSEADVIVERANKAVEQIPTLNEAHACIDCHFLFRRGAACPYCGSFAVWNVADFISRKDV